ncbi:permease [Rhizobium sp. AC44/96]|jgi:multiple sugar transport system permease protein|uniref:carbohydrate ABC transporter permease n=1 Tax=unclassified Rhizobium TaxID=2613769 RepID=UPI00080F7795|nr:MULTISPECIES: carbohydrate ABC transporter permease [unclassified Rhizobium]MDM9624138.1 carbohydrate ABC transporter permease [Rhizobium sp. S96]OCJ07910.1 permease [Rhizobium sp. AC44/96]
MSGTSSGMVGKTLGDRIILLAVVVAGLIMVVPILWVVGLSFKLNAELKLDTNSVFHVPYTVKNYVDVLGGSNVFRWFLNSLIVSSGMTLGVLILSSLAGYGFARLRFPGRDILFVIVLFGLAVPEQAVIVARHQIFSMLRLHNTYPGLILPGLAAPFGVFLMTQYFREIPKELDEAALLDNASRFKIFWKVLLPLTIPAQATLGVFTFLGAWNDYLWPLISATKKDMYTITTGIASMQMNFAQTEGLGFLMAQAVFAGLPTLVVYLFFQKYIVTAVSGYAVR